MGIINWYYYLSWQKNTEMAKQTERHQKENKTQNKSSKGIKPHPMQYQLSSLQQGIEMLADEFE